MIQNTARQEPRPPERMPTRRAAECSTIVAARMRLRVCIWLGVILAIAMAVRAYRLGGRSLWFDEGATLRWASLPAGEMMRQLPGRDMNPPGYYLLLHDWVLIFGRGEVGMRMLSAVAGTLAVLATFRLGAAMFC